MADTIPASARQAPNIRDAQRRPATERRFSPVLEGMRGLATICVLINHTAFTAGLMGYTGVQKQGFLADMVDRFTDPSLPILFVLSGMLLYRPWALAAIGGTKKPELRPYLWRRGLRAFPAYWLLTIVAMLSLNWPMVTNAWYWIRALLMMQVYQVNAMPMGMEQTWSMSTDIAFYLTLPFIAWALNRWAGKAATPAGRARRIIVPLLGLVVVGYTFNILTHLPALGQWPISNNWPPAWMDLVVIGMILATLSAAAEVSPSTMPSVARWITRWPIWCWLISLILVWAWQFSPLNDQGLANYRTLSQTVVSHGMECLIPFLMMAPLAFQKVNSPFINNVLTVWPLRMVGKISYGVYLWHIAFIYYIVGGLAGAHDFWLLTLEVIGASIGAATVSYFAVEQPAQRLRRRLGKATVGPSAEWLAASAAADGQQPAGPPEVSTQPAAVAT